MSITGLEDAWRSERDSMVRAVYLTCGDVHQAADVVDEAFLQVFSRLRGEASIDNLRGYLWRSALHGSTRARQRERRRAETSDLTARREPKHISGPDDSGLHEELLESLTRLDPKVRVVLVLRFYGDFTVPQIAAHQDLPLGTVKTMIHRGIAAMRTDLTASARSDHQ
jgi:RNA polymerase sigma-70 factor (ECF subfamily)